MRKLNLKFLLYILLYVPLFFMVGCEEKEPALQSPVELTGQEGIFIVNQGNFGYGNASLSFYNTQSREVINHIFYKANAVPLGDVGQSAHIRGNELWIVINNSGKIFIADINTLAFRNKLTGMSSPREIFFYSGDQAYVTDLYARGIYKIDPSIPEIKGFIPTDGPDTSLYQYSTEKILEYNGKLYINSWSWGDRILVMDPGTDRIVDSIPTGIQPVTMALDKNNRLWVLNDGGVYEENPVGFEPPSLWLIDPDNGTTGRIIEFPLTGVIPADLRMNPQGDSLYCLVGDLYKIPVDATVLPENPFIYANNRTLTKIFVHPGTGEIYLADAVDYQQPGWVYRYSSGGEPVDSFQVGIIPGAMIVK